MVRNFFLQFSKGHNSEKLRKGEQSFLCGTHCLDLIYIAINYHEDILKIVYGWKNRQRHAIINKQKM